MSEREVEDAADKLNLSRAVVFRLISRYRQETTQSLPTNAARSLLLRRTILRELACLTCCGFDSAEGGMLAEHF